MHFLLSLQDSTDSIYSISSAVDWGSSWLISCLSPSKPRQNKAYRRYYRSSLLDIVPKKVFNCLGREVLLRVHTSSQLTGKRWFSCIANLHTAEVLRSKSRKADNFWQIMFQQQLDILENHFTKSRRMSHSSQLCVDCPYGLVALPCRIPLK